MVMGKSAPTTSETPNADNGCPRTTMVRTTVGSDGSQHEMLNLLMLGCEDKPPYGPNDHTGRLFLDLICRTLEQYYSSYTWTVCITIYHVKELDYPLEWDNFDGILLPGSFSSACAVNVEWMDRLRHVIQTEIYAKQRPTLGICFGHQIYALSFEHGCAVKCPAGPQAGRRVLDLTQEGQSLLAGNFTLQQKQVELYYTHGDMVEQLPSCAVSLGGNERVPILAAAYFRSDREAKDFSNSSSHKNGPAPLPTPIAITFQAHPEYASPDRGVRDTLLCILEKMEQRGEVSSQDRPLLEKDALDQYSIVEQHSLEVMRMAGTLLGWFAEKDK